MCELLFPTSLPTTPQADEQSESEQKAEILTDGDNAVYTFAKKKFEEGEIGRVIKSDKRSLSFI